MKYKNWIMSSVDIRRKVTVARLSVICELVTLADRRNEDGEPKHEIVESVRSARFLKMSSLTHVK